MLRVYYSITLHKVTHWFCSQGGLNHRSSEVRGVSAEAAGCLCWQVGAGARRQRLGSAHGYHRAPGGARAGGPLQGDPGALQLPQHLPAGGPHRGLGAGDRRPAVGRPEGHR